MKKILLYVGLLLSVVACTKDKIEPEELPDYRLTQALNDYQQKLAGAENGWIGFLFPEGGGGYTFKFKFNDKNRVVSYADINATTTSTPLESSYRLKATQVPSLYFDTYSYIHILSDPDPKKSGGVQGAGLSSDFEFNILRASADSIILKGNLKGSKLILVRAKAGEGDNYVAAASANNSVLKDISKFTYYYNLLTIGGKQYNITINPDQQTVSFYYNDNGFKSFNTDYAASATGIVFKEPFVQGNVRIAEFHDLNVSVPQRKLTLTAGTLTGSTENVSTPLITDPDAAARMYSASYEYWSDFGFTAAGVTNAQNVTSIPGHRYIAYNPGYGSGYDALLFNYTVGTAARVYGPAFLTRIDAAGKMIFHSYAGNFGTSPGLPHTTTIANVRTQWLSPGGYYAFQTGKNYYDLVSATDSRIWIRFY